MTRQQQLAADLRQLADLIEQDKVYFQNCNIVGARGKSLTGTVGVAIIHSPITHTLDGSIWQSENTLTIRLSQ